MPLPAVSSLGGFQTLAAVPVETFVTAGVWKPSQNRTYARLEQRMRSIAVHAQPFATPERETDLILRLHRKVERRVIPQRAIARAT